MDTPFPGKGHLTKSAVRRITAAMTARSTTSLVIYGDQLELRSWDENLVGQMGHWGERGFPFQAFDLGYLKDPLRAKAMLAWANEDGPHRHFVACEGGKAVGRVSVNLRDESGLYLWAVHVPPEHEGRGVCRRMLAALITWLEAEHPGQDFVLSSNTFAGHAHRAYFALGFRIAETRWHFDREIAEALPLAPRALREPLQPHLRFQSGRWEVRTHVMRRLRHTPMETGQRLT